MVLIVSKNKVHSWHRRVAFYSYVHIRYFQIVGGRATASKNMRIHTVYVLFFLPFYYSTTPVCFTLSNGQPFYSSTTPCSKYWASPCSKYWARRWQQQGIPVTDPGIVHAPIKYCLSLWCIETQPCSKISVAIDQVCIKTPGCQPAFTTRRSQIIH